jgi:hypothetical protein
VKKFHDRGAINVPYLFFASKPQPIRTDNEKEKTIAVTSYCRRYLARLRGEGKMCVVAVLLEKDPSCRSVRLMR